MAWKHAIVMSWLKLATFFTLPYQYGPISLLDHCNKVYEKLLLVLMCKHGLMGERGGSYPTSVLASLLVWPTKAIWHDQRAPEERVKHCATLVWLHADIPFCLTGSLTGTPRVSPWYWFLGKLPLWTYLHVGVSGGTSFPYPMICSVPQGLGQPIYYLPAHFVGYKASSSIRWWCWYLFHEHHGKESHVSCRKNIGVVNPSKCCGLQLQETLIMSTRRNYLGILLERYLSMTPHVNVHSQIT